MNATEATLIVFAYLLGSVPTGYLLGAWMGVDVRTAGSGNIGATNVARVLGKSQGILTLAADVAKGLIPVVAAVQLGFAPLSSSLVGTAAFLGHLYPVFLKFQGGKGVATALGVFVGLAPLATLVLIVIFAAVALASRIVSLSSMAAALAAPVTLWFFSYPPAVVGVSALIASMIIIRHRANLRRLLAGTEPRFGSLSSR
ncbi:MAG: glycerol-3-phosphate 1-O-acyltransferase PlsY [Deltaproteobacteria bacterium]|nr:glycerol-3-phosphate 1-O-acyltransferase PlsY [Deltaproteobacteria bacterium]